MLRFNEGTRPSVMVFVNWSAKIVKNKELARRTGNYLLKNKRLARNLASLNFRKQIYKPDSVHALGVVLSFISTHRHRYALSTYPLTSGEQPYNCQPIWSFNT
jgi:hypothetical protein